MKDDSGTRRRSGLLASMLGRLPARLDRSRDQASPDVCQEVDPRLIDSLAIRNGVKKESSLMDRLEKKTRRVISIETAVTEHNLDKCHAQVQSALFSLPAELRLLVWQHVVAPCQEPSVGYQDAYPELRRQQKFDLDISKTCRLAWLETNGMAMRQAEHRFWLDLGDGPKGRLAEFSNAWILEAARDEKEKKARAAASSELRFAQDFTVNNRADLNSIRIFATDFWLREKFPPLMPLFTGYGGICPRILHICMSSYSFDMSMKYDTWNQKQWLARLLNKPSLSKLEEVNVDIESEVHGEREHTKQFSNGLKVDEIRILTGKLQSLQCEPIRTEDNTWRRFILQDNVDTRSWDSVHRRLDSARHFGIEGRRAHRITTYKWRAVFVDVPADVGVLDAHRTEPVLERKGGSDVDLNRAAKQVVQRWSEEQSLLKFT